jgi:hypothetical protein
MSNKNLSAVEWQHMKTLKFTRCTSEHKEAHDIFIKAKEMEQEQINLSIDYKINDYVVAKEEPTKVLGRCSGFTHDNTCILIDGACFGGKDFFMKSEWQEVEIIDGGSNK